MPDGGSGMVYACGVATANKKATKAKRSVRAKARQGTRTDLLTEKAKGSDQAPVDTAAEVDTHACKAHGPRGAIHNALLTGDYLTYATAMGKGMGFLDPVIFAEACAITRQVEGVLLGGGHTRKWQREMMAKMARIATHTDDRDHSLAELRQLCGHLLRHVGTPDRATPEMLAHSGNLLRLADPKLSKLTPEQIATCVRAELSKHKPGAASLAARLWNAANLRARGSRNLTNTAVNTASKRAIDRSRDKNDPA